MKTSKNDLTLENIEKLIDRKLVPIFGELDGIKQQGAETNLDVKILRKEMKQGFDGVYDALDEITHTLDRDLEPRIKNLERKQQFPPLQ